ncbi:MAG TPA: phenylacetate--CoA ligase family protein [Gammaproteobacteria bacterium]|nr:phenylacetate--CoA ligase family protein [Gammaproteobacteria bacterium]
MDTTAAQLDAIKAFVTTPLPDRLRTGDVERRVLTLFHYCATHVPAYRDFLERHNVSADRIQTLADYRTLPLMTKDNYIRAYPLPARCPGGTLTACDMIAMSSGSTGTATVWPRTPAHELDIAYRFEQVLRDGFQGHERRTLAVVCFALGTWVGGMFTAACLRHLALKGYPLTVATPGSNKDEIFRVVRELGPHFEQVVLLGYPPFVKDVIDSGIAAGLDWPRYRPKLVFAGEVFSEEWRALVCERIGAADPRYATASLYGTADGGVLGNETALSVNIRRFFSERPDAAREAFGESRLPTLVQYDPSSRYFESADNTLVVSGDNGVPLIRYHIADKGGLIACQDLLERVRGYGFDPLAGLDQNSVRDLPFAYIFGRADFTVSYFGANIYPENISVGLEQSAVRKQVSGKFVMQVVETDDHNEALHIVVELLPGANASESLRDTVAATIRAQLLRLNSEFANYVPAQYQMPRIVLKPAGDPEWFPVGVKHRYTRRT